MMPEMLGLAGIDAKNSGDFRSAIQYWKMAVSQMNPNSRAARGYQNGIKKAEQALLAAGESLLELRVSLDESITLSGNETVFVYARAWQGPKVPLAIQKLQVKDLPKTVRLSADMAMAPGMTIDSFEDLELVARVSLSGGPSAKSGDWQVTIGPLKKTDRNKPQTLKIANKVP